MSLAFSLNDFSGFCLGLVLSTRLLGSATCKTGALSVSVGSSSDPDFSCVGISNWGISQDEKSATITKSKNLCILFDVQFSDSGQGDHFPRDGLTKVVSFIQIPPCQCLYFTRTSLFLMRKLV